MKRLAFRIQNLRPLSRTLRHWQPAASLGGQRGFATGGDGGDKGNHDREGGKQAGANPAEPKQLRQHNQVPAYRPDQRVHMIIKESPSATKNLQEKQQFAKLIKDAAIGLHKNYKNESQRAKQSTEDFEVKIAKNFDGRTFSVFIKHLGELRKDVLDHNQNLGVDLSPDSFLIFLDKIRSLTHSQPLNEMILRTLGDINIDLLETKALLNTYQKHSADFKFEEKIRMGEIKKFAQDVMPQSRFIFDQYKVHDDSPEREGADLGDQASESDYFSFFGSHEQAILKPESSFRNLHELMTYLPIDYYILLQRGYKKKNKKTQGGAQDQARRPSFKTTMPRSNVVMFNNLPVLQQKSTFYKKSAQIVKAIAFEDVMRCLEKADAKKMLNDSYAEEEMKRLLTEYYGGSINKVEFINYHPETIVQSFHSPSGSIGKDHLNEFQQFIDYSQSKGQTRKSRESGLDALLSPETLDINEYIQNQRDFDEIMSMSSDYFSGGTSRVQHNQKYLQAIEREEILSENRLDEQRAAQYIRTRERELMGLDKTVMRSGFIVFEDYITKLKMMDHPLFLFGLKLHEMPGSVEFFDADFCNTLVIKSDLFEQQTLQQCCQMLNQMLLRNGFMGDTLEVGKLKDISEDFDLERIVVRSDYKVQLRFDNFRQAYAAYQTLQRASVRNDPTKFSGQSSSNLRQSAVGEAGDQKKLDSMDQRKLQEMGDDLSGSGLSEELVMTNSQMLVTFQNPEPSYYDGMFATQFENCIQDKFEGLDEINEVPSNYVAQALKEYSITSRRTPPGL